MLRTMFNRGHAPPLLEAVDFGPSSGHHPATILKTVNAR